MFSIEADGIIQCGALHRSAAEWLFHRLVAGGRHTKVEMFHHGEFELGWQLLRGEYHADDATDESAHE